MVQNLIPDVGRIFISRFPFEIYVEIITGANRKMVCRAPTGDSKCGIRKTNDYSLREGAGKNQPEGNDLRDYPVDKG